MARVDSRITSSGATRWCVIVQSRFSCACIDAFHHDVQPRDFPSPPAAAEPSLARVPTSRTSLRHRIQSQNLLWNFYTGLGKRANRPQRGQIVECQQRSELTPALQQLFRKPEIRPRNWNWDRILRRAALPGSGQFPIPRNARTFARLSSVEPNRSTFSGPG